MTKTDAVWLWDKLESAFKKLNINFNTPDSTPYKRATFLREWADALEGQ